MEIQAKELMIGNFVDANGVITKIESFDFSGINTCFDNMSPSYFDCEFKFSELKGIPLSEEILLKCGFSLFTNSNSHNSNDLIIYHSKINICYNNSYKKFYMFDHGIDTIYRGFQFLHELQNLYFALTGEELTVNIEQ